MATARKFGAIQQVSVVLKGMLHRTNGTTGRKMQSIASKLGTISLKSGKAHSIHCNSQVIRVLSGRAWVTFGGEDVVVKCGEAVGLPAGEHQAVISSLDEHPVVFSIA